MRRDVRLNVPPHYFMSLEKEDREPLLRYMLIKVVQEGSNTLKRLLLLVLNL